MTESSDSPRVVVPPPLVIVGTLLAGVLLDRLLGINLAPPAWLMAVGAMVTAAGLSMIGASLGLFRRARTRPEPWQASSALVQTGVYRFTRNPMYLGMLTAYIGLAILVLSPSAAALLIPLFFAIDRFVVQREEAYLARRFGDRYDAFRQKVRRWL